jgi:sporulation protein YlmC with PRC-barrel domain
VTSFDDGHAVHYTALQRGVPVISSDGEEVGTVAEVLDNFREHIFDGLIIDIGGERKFVDAPEVARTAERAVTLTITAAEVAQLGPPPTRGAAAPGGILGRLFGRGG